MIKNRGRMKWVDSLDDIKEDGYTPVKATNTMSFFRLKGKVPPEIKKKAKEYAQELIDRSKELGRDAPLSMAVAMASAKKHYGLFESEESGEITIDNLEPLIPLTYLLHSPKENRYYLKDYRGYSLTEMRDLLYSGTDPVINSLDGYIHDGNIFLLFDADGISDMTAMLTRIWGAHFTDKGKLSYTSYIDLAEAIVKLEEYKDYGRELVGFKTVCNQLQLHIDELWDIAYKAKR